MNGYEVFDRLCKERGITAYKVAQDTNVSTATLSSWKVGRYMPKGDKLKIIADYFNVPIDVFFGIEAKKPTDISLTAEEKNLVNSFRKLNPEGKLQLFRQLGYLLGDPNFILSDPEKRETYFIS